MKKITRETIYRKALYKWGEKSQKIVAIEEFAELINEVSKELNGKNKRGLFGLIDELADCSIMIEQLVQMYDVEKETIEKVGEKLTKLNDVLDGKIEYRHNNEKN